MNYILQTMESPGRFPKDIRLNLSISVSDSKCWKLQQRRVSCNVKVPHGIKNQHEAFSGTDIVSDRMWEGLEFSAGYPGYSGAEFLSWARISGDTRVLQETTFMSSSVREYKLFFFIPKNGLSSVKDIFPNLSLFTRFKAKNFTVSTKYWLPVFMDTPSLKYSSCFLICCCL